MTLHEFLTTCLADLEQSVLRMNCTCPDHGRRDANCPDFILADIEARRAIVTYLEGLQVDRSRDAETNARYLSVWWVCRELAKPFADRPGYEELWSA